MVEFDTSELVDGSCSMEILMGQSDNSGNMSKHDGTRYAALESIVLKTEK